MSHIWLADYFGKISWNTTMLICLHMIYGCFHVTMAETTWPPEAKIFTICLFTEKACQPLI